MLALVYDKELTLQQRPVPTPADGEALIEVRIAGVCQTDLEILKGYMGFRGVIGHEFVGVVAQGPARWMGKRVVGEINCPCGRCDFCRSGLAKHCPTRTVLGIAGRDGAMAQFFTLPVRNLHEVPPTVSDEEATLVEPLAAAFQVLLQVSVRPEHRAVVLGDGRLGQLVARVLKLAMGPSATAGNLLLVGKHARKLEAAEKQGIAAVPLDQFKPAGADLVIEATGSPAGLDLAMRSVRPRGTIVLKSTIAAPSGMNLAPLVVNEVTVVGSRCGPFDDALRALAARQIEVASLVTQRFTLAQAVQALQAAQSPDNIKVLIDVK